MVGGETQLLSLRISILYFLQCYLYKNESEKSKIIQKLFYQTENAANKHTLGHLLTTGILSKDIVSSWCSFIALSHLIADSQESKETILLVKLHLLRHTRIAILIFICTWLSNNSLAVQTFLSIDNTISYLISQICLCLHFNNNQISSYSIGSIKQKIIENIGFEIIKKNLEIFAQSKYYCNAQQQIHLTISEADELLIDHNFAQLFIYSKELVMSTLTPDGEIKH
ncbi:unnamed protein product [Rotaria sp. Silwood1]|nr:unnamed protein product [Rotaria sp. Silwood1]